MKYHLVTWNSMELWDCHFIQCHATLKFHGIYYGIPWNSIKWPNKKSPSSMGFHGIRRAPLQMTQVFHGIPWNIPWNSMELWWRQMKYQLVPWNSMEYSMEFHGTLVPPMTHHLFPWNSMEHSMEFHGTLVPPNEVSISSMEFHGTLVPPNEVSLSSMEFHWTLRVSFYDLLPWTSKEYSTEFHGTLESPNKKS